VAEDDRSFSDFDERKTAGDLTANSNELSIEDRPTAVARGHNRAECGHLGRIRDNQIEHPIPDALRFARGALALRVLGFIDEPLKRERSTQRMPLTPLGLDPV
jgi:hypothetical protein